MEGTSDGSKSMPTHFIWSILYMIKKKFAILARLEGSGPQMTVPMAEKTQLRPGNTWQVHLTVLKVCPIILTRRFCI